jgi:glutamine synthetase
MHTNVSVTKAGKNTFWDPAGEEKISKDAWSFIDRILSKGLDLCLVMNASVNAYRRLDPHFEAPNQVKASAVDRGSMVRVPIGNERSARIEVRSVGPDANPYMTLYSIFKTGLDADIAKIDNLRNAKVFLPDNIYDAIDLFIKSDWTTTIFTEEVKGRYAELKKGSADRCARLLGTIVKAPEVQHHHEVYNQFLWNQF